MSICLLSACKGDKNEKAKPAKTETPAEKTPQKKTATQKAPRKTDTTKGDATANKTGKTRKGYWPNLQESLDLPSEKFDKLQSLEKERRAKLSKAADKDKPAINKGYTAQKKELLGNKAYRAYRNFDKSWKNRSK